jgi:mRNA interferase RelE/StbE
VTYRLLLKPAVEKELAALPPQILRRVDIVIRSLAENPRPPGAKLLHGGKRVLRIRVGDYRVLYRVLKDRLVILVVGVGHRREVYRELQ